MRSTSLGASILRQTNSQRFSRGEVLAGDAALTKGVNKRAAARIVEEGKRIIITTDNHGQPRIQAWRSGMDQGELAENHLAQLLNRARAFAKGASGSVGDHAGVHGEADESRKVEDV